MLDSSNILNSDKNFTVFMDYLAPQERDRLTAILDQIINSPSNQPQGKDYDDWAKMVRPMVIKDFQDAREYFGFKNLMQHFNIESFLRDAYSSLPLS